MAKWASLYAQLSVIGGWAIVIVGLLAWLMDWVTADDALYILFVLGIGAVISGIALFATSWNLRLGAARLELAIGAAAPPSRDAPA